MDSIIIKDLAVRYRVGVSEKERSSAQRLLISLQLEKNLQAASKSDDLADTIDYFDLCQQLMLFGQAQNRQWKLLEKLAEEIAQFILKRYKPERVTVEIKKFVIPEANYVSIRLTRPA